MLLMVRGTLRFEEIHGYSKDCDKKCYHTQSLCSLSASLPVGILAMHCWQSIVFHDRILWICDILPDVRPIA